MHLRDLSRQPQFGSAFPQLLLEGVILLRRGPGGKETVNCLHDPDYDTALVENVIGPVSSLSPFCQLELQGKGRRHPHIDGGGGHDIDVPVVLAPVGHSRGPRDVDLDIVVDRIVMIYQEVQVLDDIDPDIELVDQIEVGKQV